MMLNFTNGSSNLSRIDWTAFDGVVAGYWLSLWEHEPPTIFNIPDKIYRSMFLYGNKHHKPHPNSGCDSIKEWVGQRVGKFPKINEWVLCNEFTDDLGVGYPDYKLDNLKRYCEAAHIANPKARLILGDFKPHLFNKWDAIANICHELAKDFPVEVGIQTHLKTYNAPVILTRLPKIIEMFDVPVHFIEASLWYKNDVDKFACDYLWGELEGIANSHQVKSFCSWWLCSEDAEVGRRMPTFESLSLFIMRDL